MPCRRYRTWHPTPSQYTDTGPTCRAGIHNYPFQCLGSDMIEKSFPNLPHIPAGMVVVSQKLGRKWTVPTGSRTCDLRHANPLHYLLGNMCFFMLFVIKQNQLRDVIIDFILKAFFIPYKRTVIIVKPYSELYLWMTNISYEICQNTSYLKTTGLTMIWSGQYSKKILTQYMYIIILTSMSIKHIYPMRLRHIRHLLWEAIPRAELWVL